MPLPTSAGTQTQATSSSNNNGGRVRGNRPLGPTSTPSSSGGGTSYSAPNRSMSVPTRATTAPQQGMSGIVQQIADLVSSAAQPTSYGAAVERAESALTNTEEEAEAAPSYNYLTGYQLVPREGVQNPTNPQPQPDQRYVHGYGMVPREGIETHEDVVARRRQDLADAERGLRRHAIGADIQGPHKPGTPAPGAGKVKPMTQEEYDALSPKARAAVDFNTMLVGAVRRDAKLADEYDPKPKQQKTYDMSVEKIFGEDGGSKSYAPETLALLRQIEFKDETADLDDFLNLTAAINARDIKHLKDMPGPQAWEAEANPVQMDRYQLAESLATDTLQMQEKLSQGNVMLSNMRQTMRADRFEDINMILGGIAKEPRVDLGFGPAVMDPNKPTAPGDLNTFYLMLFEDMANSEVDFDSKLAALNEPGTLSESERRGFMAYAENRLNQAQEYQLELGRGENVKYRSPEQLRKMLQLGGDNATR